MLFLNVMYYAVSCSEFPISVVSFFFFLDPLLLLQVGIKNKSRSYLRQVPLFNILKKFDGETVTEVVRPCIARMRYRVTKLPKYLILHMRRFTKNNFFIEKNPTLGMLCSLFFT